MLGQLPPSRHLVANRHWPSRRSPLRQEHASNPPVNVHERGEAPACVSAHCRPNQQLHPTARPPPLVTITCITRGLLAPDPKRPAACPWVQWCSHQDPQEEHRRPSRPTGAQAAAAAGGRRRLGSTRQGCLIGTAPRRSAFAFVPCFVGDTDQAGVAAGSAVGSHSWIPQLPLGCVLSVCDAAAPTYLAAPRLPLLRPQSFADALIDIIEDAREEGTEHNNVSKILGDANKVRCAVGLRMQLGWPGGWCAGRAAVAGHSMAAALVQHKQLQGMLQ